MKLLTLKRDVTSQLSTQNCLDGPTNAGARTPGSPEPARTPSKRTLSSPSRPASRRAGEPESRRAGDSACVSSGSRRKFFKRRKSRLSSFWLAAKPLSSRSRVEPSQTEARLERRSRGNAEVGPELYLGGSGWRWGQRCCKCGPASLFFFLLFLNPLYSLHLCSFKFK